ncbi:hypothetical protein K440DRAFT_580475 [Wilcoxina mikolae CBS 423.85]|nr:hypothetical protein K440DRAFT_580475 [Wilcoxina mikolae CBS 423.85]
MCKKAKCSTCNGVTWFGCGMHIPAVMDSVPENERCQCEKPAGSQYPPGASSPS